MATGLTILTGIQIGNYFLFTVTGWLWLFLLLTLGALVMAYLIIQFFRVPARTCVYSENDIFCPADGKVVVIEEVEESEYFKDKRIQISVFMSPMNVHANYNPITGLVKYVKYHPGLFLVAWHPKVVPTTNDQQLLWNMNQEKKFCSVKLPVLWHAEFVTMYSQVKK